jgi:hypothetical protein
MDLSLRLLLNLSHNPNFRALMVKAGLLGKLVGLFDASTPSSIVISLLYQLSIDEKNRSNQTFVECIPALMKSILECKTEKVPVEIMACAINIATHPNNAKLICNENGLKFLMKRALKTKDVLVFKMLRNLVQHDPAIKMMFLVSF